MLYCNACSIFSISNRLNNKMNPPLIRKPPHRKSRNGFSGAGVRLKRDGAPSGKRSRPETPLLRWKVDDKVKDTLKVYDSVNDHKSVTEIGRKITREKPLLISARKLAAGLWRLQVPDISSGAAGDGASNHQLGFQVFYFKNSYFDLICFDL